MGADVISALAPFGPVGLAIVAIVVVLASPARLANWLVALALGAIAFVFGIDRFTQAAPITDSKPIASGASEEVFWFDTSTQADWGGRDVAYTKGYLPRYLSVQAKPLCDAAHLGNVVTCWDNRRGGQAAGIDSDVTISDSQWCAYKERSVRISSRPDGQAPQGQIFVCARYIPRK